MNFTQELEDMPEIAPYLRDAINNKYQDMQDPEEDPKLPKLDNDFSKIMLLNGLPKCDRKKSEKLQALIIKLFSKKGIEITEENIEQNRDEEDMTTGQCFITLKSEEQARIAAT